MAGQWHYNPFTKKLDYYDDADTKLPITSLVLPFYDSDGNLDTIPLTADSKLPFYKADGNSSDIALTT